jgi:FMN phosphatase YigB (HAD superfamily)
MVHVGRYRFRVGPRMKDILLFLRDEEEPVPRSLLVRMLQDDCLISRQAAHQALARARARGLVIIENGDGVALHPRLRRLVGAGSSGA